MPSRTNWHDQHPIACTCVYCQDGRRIRDTTKGKIGRNEKCPCGSGKKYKRCHLS